jgi:hypothetical protein
LLPRRLRNTWRDAALLRFRNVDLHAIAHDNVAWILARRAGTEPFGVHRHGQLAIGNIRALRCHGHRIGAVKAAGIGFALLNPNADGS